MRNLGEWILGREIETNNYPLGSVDVYFEMDYLTFTTMYKDDYDFVIVDFGCYSRKRESMKEFIRIQNKYIVASGIDWNLGKLEDFMMISLLTSTIRRYTLFRILKMKSLSR